MSLRFSLRFMSALLLLSPAVHGTGMAEIPVEEQADAIVREAMKTHRIPGVCLGIIRNGHLIKATGYGYANVELGVAVSPKSIFQSGSVAKQFTATAVMMLVQDGKIGLDDAVSRYLPEARTAPWKDVTVRQLLTHTSGIPDIFGESDDDSYTKGILDFRRDYTEEELLQKYSTLALDFSPGEKWNYSNTGYEVLGFLIHRVSECSTATFCNSGFSRRWA